MAKVSIFNDIIVVPLELLSDSELSTIQKASSYTDTGIAYQIKNLRMSYYSSPAKIKALEAQLKVTLWDIVDTNLVLPQGFEYLIPTRLEIEDLRVLPKRKKMIWYKQPTKTLRYYQREAVDALLKRSRGQAVMSTGSGKSFTLLNLVRETGLKTLIICPSTIIGEQLYEEFAMHFGKKLVGMYGAGKKELKQITIGLYQSVTKNIELFQDVELIAIDESQTLGASSLVEISRKLAHVPYCYSVSATNYRADGKTPEIYACSGEVVYLFDAQRAIKEGFLAQPFFYVRDVTSSGGNFDRKQANYSAHVLHNPALNAQIVTDARKMLERNMSVLILVQEIEHGALIAAELGAPTANGENKGSKKLINDLNSGAIKCLVAGAAFCGIGTDTVRVDCLIIASFPGTEGLTTQLVGRGLRMYPGKKKVIVLDYIPLGNGMLKRHGENRIDWYKSLGPVTRIGLKDNE